MLQEKLISDQYEAWENELSSDKTPAGHTLRKRLYSFKENKKASQDEEGSSPGSILSSDSGGKKTRKAEAGSSPQRGKGENGSDSGSRHRVKKENSDSLKNLTKS